MALPRKSNIPNSPLLPGFNKTGAWKLKLCLGSHHGARDCASPWWLFFDKNSRTGVLKDLRDIPKTMT